MPPILQFWVISTALVLHGVIISFLGPLKEPEISAFPRCSAPENNQDNLSKSSILRRE